MWSPQLYWVGQCGLASPQCRRRHWLYCTRPQRLNTNWFEISTFAHYARPCRTFLCIPICSWFQKSLWSPRRNRRYEPETYAINATFLPPVLSPVWVEIVSLPSERINIDARVKYRSPFIWKGKHCPEFRSIRRSGWWTAATLALT